LYKDIESTERTFINTGNEHPKATAFYKLALHEKCPLWVRAIAPGDGYPDKRYVNTSIQRIFSIYRY
jgi:hypothetical protein